MKRTTLSLSEELATALDREARRRGSSVSQVARDALSKHFGLSGEGRRSLGFAKLGRSGTTHTGRDHEEALEDLGFARDR